MSKKLFYTLGALSVFVLASCQKEASIESAEPTTSQKILGKWMLAEYVEECYKPLDHLISRNSENGKPGDSLVFKRDGNLYSYSDIDGNFVDNYELLNDQKIKIEFEEWKIAKLTEQEFNLVSEEIGPEPDEKNIVRIFLKRK